jgi:Na+/H+-dicarboxylate symporter
VLLGLVLGIAAGVFFGESAASVQIVGDAFIQLLQMTVIPYIAVSLIGAVGRLDYRTAAQLALKGGAVLVLTWGIALTFVVALPLAFPEAVSATFFSTSLVAEREPFDFLSLYIPSNPLFSMAHNIVPAVVLFSIAVGVALIGVERKEGLLRGLSALDDALMGVTGFVARLAPIGVFALTASAAGTMGVEELERLQIYLVVYALAALLLTFFVLPGLVAALTPLRWRDVVPPTRGPVITAFATGNLLIVIPMLSHEARQIAAARAADPDDAEAAVEVIVPASFNFPSAGKLLTLTYLPFAGWFVGASIDATDYPAFLVTGLFSFFGSTATAIPFLLDFLRIPADLFQIFLTVDVIASRFGVMLAAMNTVCLALLGAFAIGGGLRVRPIPLLRFAGLSAGVLLGLVVGVRLFYSYVLDLDPGTYQKFVEMDMKGEALPARLVTEEPPVPTPLAGPRLARIEKAGLLRVCYLNARNRLVGFDAEMANLLARELGVRLQFVRVSRSRVGGHLTGGTCDLAMSSVAITTQRAREMAFSTPYLDLTLAFVVRDHRRQEFGTWQRLRDARGLRLAVPPSRYYKDLLKSRLPEAELVPLGRIRSFFQKAEESGFDGLLFAAEPGSAWTLVYPHFSVVVPEPGRVKVPMGYGMPLGDASLVEFVNTWLTLKQRGGTIDELFQHWILGRAAQRTEPRWSVLHDVLHWGRSDADTETQSEAPDPG